MLIALDPENQGRSAYLGKKQPLKGDPDLQHYLGRLKYDPAEDIELVECSCTDYVGRRFLREKLTTSLGGVVNRWKTDERTKRFRVPVVLYLGGCCQAFDYPRYTPRVDGKDAERFLRYFRQLVVRYGQNPDADPKLIEPEDPRDNTINLEAEDVRDEVNTGPVRINSRLLSIPAIPSRAPMFIEKRTALIVVAKIALLRPRLEGGPRKPYVISLVLANGFGRVLTIFDSGPKEAVIPAGVIDHEGRHATIDEMRQAILKRLGNINALVGFYLGWTLTALNLFLPACRVVDLGAEEAYQLLCFKMVSNSVWKTLLFERLAHSLDRRIPAML